MNSATLIVLWVTLFFAWTMIPMIIVQYRLVVVPRRYQEIEDRFLGKPLDGSEAQDGGRGKSAAWYYARLLAPDADNKDPEKVLKAQFWYFHSWKLYALPLVLVALLSGLMLGFSGLWIADRLTDFGAGTTEPAILHRVAAPFIMALWGAFVWSLYEIWSRRKSGDLTPVEVFDVAIRFVVAIPIGYAFSLLVFQTVPSLAAFIASAFPLRDVRQVMRKQALQKLSESAQGSSTLASRGHVGEVLNGIGNDTTVRLEELNIETFNDLAYADPIRLMVKTGVPIQLVLAWVDQALLAVYAAPHKAKFDLLGMPCALDVREFYLAHCFDLATGKEKDWRNAPAVKGLADKLDIPLEILPQLLRSIHEDPHVQFLARAWYGSDPLPGKL
jgi:hypothetical protein